MGLTCVKVQRSEKSERWCLEPDAQGVVRTMQQPRPESFTLTLAKAELSRGGALRRRGPPCSPGWLGLEPGSRGALGLRGNGCWTEKCLDLQGQEALGPEVFLHTWAGDDLPGWEQGTLLC